VGRFHAELEKGTKAKNLGAQTVGKDAQMPKNPQELTEFHRATSNVERRMNGGGIQSAWRRLQGTSGIFSKFLPTTTGKVDSA
jgi:hypothetical protein